MENARTRSSVQAHRVCLHVLCSGIGRGVSLFADTMRAHLVALAWLCMLLACLRDTMQNEGTREHAAREPLLATSIGRDPSRYDQPVIHTPNSQVSKPFRGYIAPSHAISHMPSCANTMPSCSISGTGRRQISLRRLARPAHRASDAGRSQAASESRAPSLKLQLPADRADAEQLTIALRSFSHATLTVQHALAKSVLFDLRSDPAERRDVGAEHPLALRYLRGQLGLALSDTTERAARTPAVYTAEKTRSIRPRNNSCARSVMWGAPGTRW